MGGSGESVGYSTVGVCLFNLVDFIDFSVFGTPSLFFFLARPSIR